MSLFNILIAYLIVINILGLIQMGIDKRRAINHAWRISEKTLWITTIIGGAIGSYIGMRLFHHKTKHTSFKIGVPFLIIVQLVVYVYIFPAVS